MCSVGDGLRRVFKLQKMSSEKFCLKWNDFESNISSAFKDIRDEKEFFDITIACEDDQLQAHKVILSACSPFFKNVLRRNQHQHPLLYLKGVSFKDMEAVLNFMYHGEVNVAQDDLNSFLQVAEDLRVKGLTQNNSGNSSNESKKLTTLPKTEPRSDLSHPRPSEYDITPTVKRPRATPSTTRIIPQPLAQHDEDIEEIVPVVKSEPSDPVATPIQSVVQSQPVEQQQTLAMYDDGSQQMQASMMEQYDDNYGEEYDGQFVDDQGYDTSMMGTGGQDASGAGKVKCSYCDLMMHPNSMNRHITRVHTEQTSIKCVHCGNNYKGEINLKEHLRIAHKVYQNR